MAPPPPPTVRAPPVLLNELVEEVLFRFPPDDPASLVRAAVVCKRWCRLVTSRAFRRRFRDFHLRRRPAPMLGFFRNVFEERGSSHASSSRLVRTSTTCPPLDTQRGWLALDARGGRVLIHRVGEAQIRLAVWDPLSAGGGRHLGLPVPILPQRPRSWNAALLCCDQHGLQDNADEPFRVVLVGTDPAGAFACVYSSIGPAVWSQLAYTDPGDVLGGRIGIARDRGALVGNALYFLFVDRMSIFKYDLATGDISVIRLLPPASYSSYIGPGVLITTEDGSLGLPKVVGDKLHLWSMLLSTNGGALAMGFTQGRTIDLSRMLPSILLGFADDVGIILLRRTEIFSFDQKSGQMNKLGDIGHNFYCDMHTVPYSFYTAALVTASTDEGPSADASGLFKSHSAFLAPQQSRHRWPSACSTRHYPGRGARSHPRCDRVNRPSSG